MADWRNRRVLVTGGAGFIGANLCHELVRRDAIVWLIDSYDRHGGALRTHLGYGDGVANIISHDVCAAEPYWFDGQEVIFNLAAQTSHLGAQEDPGDDLLTNAEAQINMIKAARYACPSAVVVHASTRQVYGRPDYLPVDEAHPIRPPDCNAISKFAGEQYWLLEHRIHGRPVTALRLTNVYGPHMRIRDARQNFYGDWIRRALKGEPIEVWGGAQLRDMAYVDDVVDALILAADSPGGYGRALNVGGAETTSLLQLADLTLLEAGGGTRTVREMPAARAAIDIGSVWLDDAAFRAVAGWEPKVRLCVGIGRTLAWFREHLGDYT